MLVSISRQVRLVVGAPTFLGSNVVGGTFLRVRAEVAETSAQALRITCQEGNDWTHWAQVGDAEDLLGTGGFSLILAGITQRYSRILIEAIGPDGKACSVAVTVEGADS